MARYSKINSFNALQTLTVGEKSYQIFNLPQAAQTLGNIDQLPKSLKVLLENLLRFEDQKSVKVEHIQALVDWQKTRSSDQEIQYRPARVLMQDFTGVPAVVDLAAMRAAMAQAGGDPNLINPLSPVDLVIDHSVMVDHFADKDAFAENVEIEMQRNGERYQFLRWGQSAFNNFSVVPPGTGICHQVNLEYLAQAVWLGEDEGQTFAFPDTLVGTDSHTTMINGLGVLGWGVGGIEAEAAMLGQPVSMLIPEVIGFKLTGKLNEGITATDLVLTITQMLRQKGVVGKFVEFYGDGLADLPLADRATIANMAPEYGATCGFFPIDDVTLAYLALTGREQQRIDLVEAYSKAQGLWRNAGDEPVFTDTLSLDMSTVQASLAGPKRPQDRVLLSDVPKTFHDLMELNLKPAKEAKERLENEGGGTAVEAKKANLPHEEPSCTIDGKSYPLNHGDVVISAITSCTNTSNPSVMLAAGLLAKKAIEKGLQRKPWVKSSLAPGSKVVTDYLAAAGLTPYLDELGYNLVGYGCTTCIGNSGPLPEPIEEAIQCHDLNVASVLSGNRNFEGRVHPLVKTNWLASPPLVVAYGLTGNIRTDLTTQPIGLGKDGQAVYLKDIWPSQAEIDHALQSVNTAMFHKEYAAVFDGDAAWQAIQIPQSQTYAWQENSTYIRHPPFFEEIGQPPDLVAECIAEMQNAVDIPVTVKHRIGIDDMQSYEEMLHFVDTVAKTGCNNFIVHARIALLQGLSPKENRDVPPLRYDDVYRLKQERPNLLIEINGGIKTFAETQAHLEHVDGVMIGREAYHNPYLLAEIGQLWNLDLPDRFEIIDQMLPYIAKRMQEGAPLSIITRHILGLFQNLPGARKWRQALSGGNAKTFADVENAILNIKDAMQRTEDYLKEHTLAQ